jgi:precorrin-2/cobalt-factor-2 C20-methyltransferase
MKGKLFGVGVGPGDPELLTIKAVNVLRSVSCIAFPILEDNKSFSRAVVGSYLGQDVKEIPLIVPMTVARGPAQKAYDLSAKKISKVLEKGKNVACLCEGDPFFYGSFMYIFSRLSKYYEIEVIPGITSLTAGTSVAKLPLLARNEHLVVIPAPLKETEIRNRVLQADSVVIMKVGRHLKKIKSILYELGLGRFSTYIEHATLPSERVCKLIDAPSVAPYFSMIIVTKGADPWL